MIKDISNKLLESIREVMDGLKEEQVEEFTKMIVGSDRIFIAGAGRSGLVSKSFAMRLMHLGFTVFVVGETTTPSISPNDLFIAVSGSGKTSSIANIVKTVKTSGIKTVGITSYPDSVIGKLSDCIIEIPGRIKNGPVDYDSKQLEGKHEPLTPLGTLFEMSTGVFLDSIVAKLMIDLGKKEAELKERHANLE